jgi:hypothetical protein
MSALRERGQAPYIDAHQAGEDLGFGIAKHRELRREALYGAVALAELDTGESGRERGLCLDGMRRGHEPVTAQGLGQSHGAGRDVISGCFYLRRVPALHVREAFFCIVADCVFTCQLLETPQRRTCDVEIVVAEL